VFYQNHFCTFAESAFEANPKNQQTLKLQKKNLLEKEKSTKAYL